MSIDYEQQQAQEIAECQRKLKIALQIGKALGAKYDAPEEFSKWNRSAHFTFANKPYSIYIGWNEYGNKGKFSVSGRYDQIRNAKDELVSLKWRFERVGAVEHCSINLSQDKSVEVIAKQIQSRLLTEMEKGVAIFNELVIETKEMDNKFAGVVTRLNWIMSNRSPDKITLNTGSVGDYKFRAIVSKYNECPIELTIGDLNEDQAGKVIQFVQSLKIAKKD